MDSNGLLKKHMKIFSLPLDMEQLVLKIGLEMWLKAWQTQ